MTEENTNCLAGMKCPECGSLGPFRFPASCWAIVNDDGVEESTDFDWDENAIGRCVSCGHECKIRDLRNVPLFFFNMERAERAESALAVHVASTNNFNEPDKDQIVDLLTDLLHYAKRKRVDIDDVMFRARNHYDTEASHDDNEDKS